MNPLSIPFIVVLGLLVIGSIYFLAQDQRSKRRRKNVAKAKINHPSVKIVPAPPFDWEIQ
jgi:hypothetical protein